MKYFDFWFSPEGSSLINYGIEGEDYTVTDGKAKYTETALSSGVPLGTYLEQKGALCQGIGGQFLFDYELAAMSESGRQGIELYREKNYVGDCNLPPLNYTAEEQTQFNKLNGDITTYYFEVYQKWTMGDGDIDAEWDGFVSRVEQMGLDKMMQIQQQAYDRFLQQ